jgi:hypothetical protein
MSIREKFPFPLTHKRGDNNRKAVKFGYKIINSPIRNCSTSSVNLAYLCTSLQWQPYEFLLHGNDKEPTDTVLQRNRPTSSLYNAAIYCLSLNTYTVSYLCTLSAHLHAVPTSELWGQLWAVMEDQFYTHTAHGDCITRYLYRCLFDKNSSFKLLF